MLVECTRIFMVNVGCFVCYAEFFLPETGMELYACKMFQKDGKAWINFPSREYLNEKEERKFVPYIRFRERAKADIFSNACIEAIRKKMEEEKKQKEEVAQESVPDELPF